ncbi:ATP-binding protein [Kitasatospora sp. NPDC058190]|uniref:HD domain-containing protein n=1 Tax=Kitasatospora sp. NPDC058190 TaxID=3346371 RepID=UPI0036DB653C
MQELLSRIGSYGFFDEYTKHDISHIDAMLEKLDWLIPPHCRELMTSADWLLIVLATYFHDLGMLVTKDEYARRSESGFERFRDEVLLTQDDSGKDYAARLTHLGADDRERFLYQEFVRHHHATRVKNWIEGEENRQVGVTDGMREEVQRILSPVTDIFRDDLAKVCESHHLDDLYDEHKYPVAQFYGQNEQESANVQYSAVLLRTIDLLHITQDRVPSIAFRVLNPTDPISQDEWAKQSAVRAVKPKWGTDSEGNLSEAAHRDTISVHARFTEGNGFFGLTSYLSYAEAQLRKSNEWISRSNQTLGTKLTFPWKHVDTAKVEAKGFLTETFGFKLDQAKVLDLLTGHTLYNDPSVVVRELLQNSIDAIRLQHGDRSELDGKVQISWDSEARTLEVLDNGSGMTQEIIENNLLRAGSSRYQDPQFRKSHPNFHPISRFGIGVLSTFMVADNVEIITCHPDEKDARQLSLRSVHGKYLVRLLNKSQDVPREILPHGTLVRLTVRPSAKVDDVLRIAKGWIVVPRCNVDVVIDRKEPENIGFKSVGDALRSSLLESGYLSEDLNGQKVRIVERDSDGLSIAYAVGWNNYFKEWGFLLRPQRDPYVQRRGGQAGTCVEGIRVEATAPGFQSSGGIWAFVNAYGPSAPRTNVARSALDSSHEYKVLLERIYSAYCGHITEEVNLLQTERSYSLTWATGEAAFLATPLMRDNAPPKSAAALRESMKDIPLFVLEESDERRQASAKHLDQFETIYTMESAAAEHIEYLLRELPSTASRTSLLKELGGHDSGIPENIPLLCTRLGSRGVVDDFFYSSWQIAEVHGSVSHRRCDFKWIKTTQDPRWSGSDLTETNLRFLLTNDARSYRSSAKSNLVRIPIGDVTISGLSDYFGVVAGNIRYLLPNHPWAPMVDRILDGEEDISPYDDRLMALSWLIASATHSRSRNHEIGELKSTARRSGLAELVDIDEFSSIAESSDIAYFDTRRWNRNAVDDSYL